MAKIRKNKKEEIATGEKAKMTIYEYEQKYSKRQNERGARILLRLIAAAIGVLIFTCLLLVTLRFFDIHMYAGIAAAVVSLVLFIAFFIVPLVKIFKIGAFQTNVNAYTAREAIKHNRKLRHEIAGKIIEVTATVDGVGWYDSEIVGRLAIAMSANDEEDIKAALTALYNGSVKASAKSLITKCSVKSAMYSAISQTNRVDSLLVAFLNLQLVKDLVYLYGFRPSDAKLVKIFARVLQNSLIAYGMGSVKIGNSIVQTMGNAVKGIPLLGSAISAFVDSSVQGLTNGVLTAVMGYQTIKYLSTEYKLQDVLDGVELGETDEELQETCKEVEKELKAKPSKMPQAV